MFRMRAFRGAAGELRFGSVTCLAAEPLSDGLLVGELGREQVDGRTDGRGRRTEDFMTQRPRAAAAAAAAAIAPLQWEKTMRIFRSRGRKEGRKRPIRERQIRPRD